MNKQTDSLAGKIGTYMAKYATTYMKENGKLIACITALNYMSTYKMFFLSKFRYVNAWCIMFLIYVVNIVFYVIHNILGKGLFLHVFNLANGLLF